MRNCAQYVGKHVDKDRPILEGRLPDGSRIHVVLPPIARLTPAQARYHFLSGYTAKVAGTERGLGGGPRATFSACFGQPFLPLHPATYSRLLGEKLARHKTTVWMVNTSKRGSPRRRKMSQSCM